MNWIDLIILSTFLFFALEAIKRPLILELLDFTSFLISFFVSFRYYNLPAQFFVSNFHIPHGLSLVLGFMTAWFLTEILFFFLLRLFLPKIPILQNRFLNSLSIIPALLRGIVFIALTLVLIGTFPIQPFIKKAVLDSKIGSVILEQSIRLEEPVKSVFGGVTEDTLTFLTIKPKTNERVDLGFTTSNFSADEKTEMAMIDLVNKERAQKGLKALVFNSGLRTVGRVHSADMFSRGYFAHFSPEGKTVADRAEENSVDFLVIGENLAYAPTLELAYKGLMNSEGHRANILSKDFGKIGIGVMDGGIYGKMFTQVFSN